MSNNELKTVIDYMEREKGLDRNVLIETVRSSLQSAARKSVGDVNAPIINVDPETFDVTVFEEHTVVSDEEIPRKGEIKHRDAILVDDNIKVGDTINKEVTPKNFGRIAAQTAKQVIIQKIREAEANVVYTEFKDRIGQIITGTVRHIDRRGITIDLDRGEANLPSKERLDSEEYRVGDRLKLYVIDVKMSGQNSEILVSRSHPNFVRRLFEIEVPEISDGTIEIKGVAREPGYRTKIAVFSNNQKVDCVGACVGMRGTRVKNIVQELNGEKIDIVPWSPELITFCRNALNPAKIKQVNIDEDSKTIHIKVDKSQFSLAIGKRGANARLTSKLLGWRIDIDVLENDESLEQNTPSSPKKEKHSTPSITLADNEKLAVSIDVIEDISNKVKGCLEEAGYKTLGELTKLTIDELYTIPGVGSSSAGEIMGHIQNSIKEALKDS